MFGLFLLKKKCFQYWPDFFSGFNDYDSLHVKFEQKVDGGFFVTRYFTISKKGSKDTRNVQHFQLLDWVQSKIPQSTEKFFDFVQTVRRVVIKHLCWHHWLCMEGMHITISKLRLLA